MAAPAPPRRPPLPGPRRVVRPAARVATLHGYLELTRSLGLDPAELLSAVRLRPADLADPDAWVPAAAVGRLLELTAERSGREGTPSTCPSPSATTGASTGRGTVTLACCLWAATASTW